MTIPKSLQTKTAKVVMLAALVLTVVTVLRAIDPAPVAQLRERSFDLYQHLQPRPYADFPVRVVDLDDASLTKHGQWPWPRTLVARFVQRLSDLGAAVIALDMVFPEPDRTSPARVADNFTITDPAELARVKNVMAQLPDHDQILAQTIERAPVVLGFGAVPTENGQRPPLKAGFALAGADPTKLVPHFGGATISLDLLEKAASGTGAMNVSGRDTGGIVRRVPLLFSDGKKTYPNLSAEALRVAQQQQSIIVRGTAASG